MMKKMIVVVLGIGAIVTSAYGESKCTYNPYNPPNPAYGGTVKVGDTVGHFSTLKKGKGSLYGQIEALTCNGSTGQPIAKIRITDCSGFCGTRDPESRVTFREGTILQAEVVAKDSDPSFGDFSSWAVTH